MRSTRSALIIWQAAVWAAEHLLELGHRDIVYLGNRPNSLTHQLRLRGFTETLEKAGITPQVIDNPHGCSSIDIGCALSRELVRKRLFRHCRSSASTDSMALGVLQAADEYGISIPEDISLLGFDNIIYSALPKIELSTIDQRKQLLAEAAVDLLTRIIDSDEQDEFTHRMIRPTLVSRSSCRAPKK